MAKYRFYFEREMRGHIDVEADSLDEAYDKAYEEDGEIEVYKEGTDYEFVGELKDEEDRDC